MKRTQIYLHEDQHKTLMTLVKQRKKPMGELIRLFIKEGLKKEDRSSDAGIRALEKLMKIKATEGPIDLSRNIDHYLYGFPKKSK